MGLSSNGCLFPSSKLVLYFKGCFKIYLQFPEYCVSTCQDPMPADVHKSLVCNTQQHPSVKSLASIK